MPSVPSEWRQPRRGGRRLGRQGGRRQTVVPRQVLGHAGQAVDRVGQGCVHPLADDHVVDQAIEELRVGFFGRVRADVLRDDLAERVERRALGGGYGLQDQVDLLEELVTGGGVGGRRVVIDIEVERTGRGFREAGEAGESSWHGCELHGWVTVDAFKKRVVIIK